MHRIIKSADHNNLNLKPITTYKGAKTQFYRSWQKMKERCLNKNNVNFKNYGGRGILLEPAWENFQNFYTDMFLSYREGLELDRIDNNGNYCKDNCRWVTHSENNRNKRTTKTLSTPKGEMCFAAIEEAFNLREGYISKMFYQGRNRGKSEEEIYEFLRKKLMEASNG